MEFSDDYIDKLLKQIYSGEINATNLPFGLYRNVCEYLLEGIKIGYDIEVPNQVDIALKDAFNANINIFSGAKTFQYVLANEGLLLDNEGKLKDWNIFKTESRVLFEKFNKHWLEAEYFTTVGQATEAKKWREFEKHKNEFPLLEYVASIDDKTSPICASKDGIVRRVDDPFWNGNKPLSHYRCRCVLISHAYGDAEITQDISKVIPAEGIFAQDPSKTGQIFDKSHPYFDIAGKYKTFAKTNFNLPIIELENKKTIINKPIEIPKKIKIEGFKGEQTYGTLTGNKLNIQKEIESKLGIKVPDKLLENIPNNLNIRYSKVNAYFNDGNNTICLDTDSKTKIKNLAHEFGHLNHYKLNQVYTENGVRKYSDEFKELYKEFSNELKEKGISNIDKICRERKDIAIIERMPVLDCLGEASNGLYGGGHTKTYYKKMQRGVEFFAHISENYFVGNDFFKEILPNTYKLGNDYMKKILKD